MYTKEFEEGFIIPFIKRLTSIEASGRAVAFLAGPPAAGKSTLAARIEEISLTVPGLEHVQALPMDGFHKKQAYLKSHYFLRDGVETPLTEIKGAPETFDVPALDAALKKVKSGDDLRFPSYERLLHDTVDDAIDVTARAVVIEGNYLLLDRPGWRGLKKYADMTVFITAEPSDLLERLIERKTSTGRTYEYAKAFAENSDLKNAKIILEESMQSDITIRTDGTGRMEVLG